MLLVYLFCGIKIRGINFSLMKRVKIQSIFIVLAIPLLWISNVSAATVNATSCSLTHVQAAINAASAGDTVVVPAGTCTWNSSVNISTGITLQGAGIGNTVITKSGSFGQTVSLAANARAIGFTFTNGYASSNKQNWVVQDCRMTASSYSGFLVSGMYENEYPTGVFHGCEFNRIRIGLVGPVEQGHYWDDEIDWSGYSNIVFFENCTWTGLVNNQNALDANYSGRYVVRFCTLNDGVFEAHGSRGPTCRGAQFIQIYRNTINNSVESNAYAATNIRGSLKVLFDNNCTGSAAKCEYGLHTERGDPVDYWYGIDPCDGESIYDTEPHPGTGNDWMCRDATGVGRDTSLSEDLPAAPEPQTYEPAYIWNNTYEGATGEFVMFNGSEAVVIEDRDYFLDASSDPDYGNGGVTSDTWANRPTCNASKKNHGYWATDMGGNWNTTSEWGGEDGALYVCDGVDTWVLHYTPAPYPHPLLLRPPQNLRIISSD